MSFNEVKDKISDFFKKVISFFLEDKRRSIIILLASLILILIILLIVSITHIEKKSDVQVHEIVFSEELLIPEGPQTTEDYTVSRKTPEEWSVEETENWFTVPSAKEVEKLADANDNLISDVIGAAP